MTKETNGVGKNNLAPHLEYLQRIPLPEKIEDILQLMKEVYDLDAKELIYARAPLKKKKSLNQSLSNWFTINCQDKMISEKQAIEFYLRKAPLMKLEWNEFLDSAVENLEGEAGKETISKLLSCPGASIPFLHGRMYRILKPGDK